MNFTMEESGGAAGRSGTCQHFLDPDEKGGGVTGRLIPRGPALTAGGLLLSFGPAEVAEPDLWV